MGTPAGRSGGPRKRLSGEQRRQQIARSARDVFIAHGLRGARTKDIAAAAGVNEALLYRHYGSKEALFEAAVVAPLEEAVAKLVLESSEPPTEGNDPAAVMAERTRVFLGDLLDVLEEIAPLLGLMLFGDESTAGNHLTGRVTPYLERTAEVVVANLAWWPHRDFDPRLLVRLVFGGAWFEAVNARLTGRPMDKDRLADEISQLMVRGLVTPPG